MCDLCVTTVSTRVESIKKKIPLNMPTEMCHKLCSVAVIGVDPQMQPIAFMLTLLAVFHLCVLAKRG